MKKCKYFFITFTLLLGGGISLSKTKEVNGVVYYSRANAQGEPLEQAMQVMKLSFCYLEDR